MPVSPLTPRSAYSAFDSCNIVSKCAAKHSGVASPTRRLDRRGGTGAPLYSRHRRMRTLVSCHMLVACLS